MNQEAKNINILTDIRIIQSRLWCDATINTEDLKSRLSVFDYGGRSYNNKWFRPCVSVMKIIQHMHAYDVVITGNIRTSQLLCIYRKLFHIKHPKHVILEFRLDEGKKTNSWKIKHFFQKCIFSSVDLACVPSTAEIDIYSGNRLDLQKRQLKFIPFHTNVVQPRFVEGTGKYVLAAGKAGRDYSVLAEAVKGLAIETYVVADRESIREISFPMNVKTFVDIPYHEYMRLLENCLFVIVPLKDVHFSTGQVVILESMAMGKPVVATKTIGTIDYIQHGTNGILVPPSNPHELRRWITFLYLNTDSRKEFAENALRTVREKHTFDVYINSILKTVEELLNL